MIHRLIDNEYNVSCKPYTDLRATQFMQDSQKQQQV